MDGFSGSTRFVGDTTMFEKKLAEEQIARYNRMGIIENEIRTLENYRKLMKIVLG